MEIAYDGGNEMTWASSVSDDPELTEALSAAAVSIREGLRGRPPDLVIAFASEHHRAGYTNVARLLAAEFPGTRIVGCSAGGVIGGGEEVEHRPGVSLTAAALPGVSVDVIRIRNEELPGLDCSPREWRALVKGEDESRFEGRSEREEADEGEEDVEHFILFADPYSCDAERLIQGLDYAFPSSIKIGGIASGGQVTGYNVLFRDEEVFQEGAVLAVLKGKIECDAIVAQGCRPIGVPMTVTAGGNNVIRTLDGRPALLVLQEIFETLDPRDRELFRNSLFLGLLSRPYEEEYGPGDFLVRNLVGVDPSSGALMIGAVVKVGQIVQFHLRDAETSAQDLELLLDHYTTLPLSESVRGALLFSCLGRGMYLYGRPNHDTDLFREKLGNIPVGGFFANGEIGPIQGTTYIHGYTSAFGLFRPKG
ncbi:MAG: hypothetical protein D6679_08360 [Candidatus Hydrogenedentota bacterium]|nr:MAG: hypothetical protein D6679_08360 [Candidatus Hydrogenedentota bacterium]